MNTAESSTPAENEDSVDADAENYGESEFVNGETSEDFFAQARLEKMTNRDEAVQTLQAIMGLSLIHIFVFPESTCARIPNTSFFIF